MILKRFQVTNFRSIMDSSWIDCDNITSLVGVNEAGKSNLLLALWKLNPAREEGDAKIEIRDDIPRGFYTEWKGTPEDIKFITAEFELGDDLSEKISSICGCNIGDIKTVQVSRYFDEQYRIDFPGYNKPNTISVEMLLSELVAAKNKVEKLQEVTETIPSKNEEDDDIVISESGIKDSVIASLCEMQNFIQENESLNTDDFSKLKSMIPTGLKHLKSSKIFPVISSIKQKISDISAILDIDELSELGNIFDLIIDEMPAFVYYSDYGNLDAEIYLPQAVQILEETKAKGFNNTAKVRTLRMLFEFVKLDPSEIWELGKDPSLQKDVETITRTITKTVTKTNHHNNTGTVAMSDPEIETSTKTVGVKPSEKEIESAQDNKAERTIQLNSAATNLTKKFKAWWKQGDYTFRFVADGDYFKIWVSDSVRSDEIELRERSAGLQWFFSFFLVFLVESQEAHKGTILLLDEAGLTLHPLAQKDLVAFFENLSESNQIVHTTHSPFLIDINNIERAKVVYVDDDGYTVASSNLREGITPANRNSIYAAHAALGLSVSDVILHGCHPVIVEGESDQHLLNAIKLYLIREGKISPTKELVFLPAGGTSKIGVQGIVGILGGKNEELPHIVLDSDSNGKALEKNLISGLYGGDARKRIITTQLMLNLDNSEVEDLLPYYLMKKELRRILHNDYDDVEFEDGHVTDKPIMPQIEQFANDKSIALKKGWKVELSKKIKNQLLKPDTKIEDKYVDIWMKLFNHFVVSATEQSKP